MISYTLIVFHQYKFWNCFCLIYNKRNIISVKYIIEYLYNCKNEYLMQQLNPTYRIFSLSLAILVFFSSVGLTIDMHYCQGELKSVSFVGKAKSCHNTQLSSTVKMCPHHQKMMDNGKEVSAEQNDCCKNNTVRFQSDDDKNLVLSDMIMHNVTLNFVVAFVATLYSDNIHSMNGSSIFKVYHSPLISRDIYVLYETFII